MSDLDKLIEAVEAGGWPDRQTEVAAFYSGGSIAHCNECAGLARQANAGSLDAALRLHEALLPGWHYRITRGKHTPEAIVQRDLLAGEHASAETGTPSRAWLLAILKALRAKAAP